MCAKNRWTKLSFSMFLLLGLASCGGGGSGNEVVSSGSNSAGCIDEGNSLTGETTVIVWDGNLCVTDGESVNLLKDLKSRTGVSGLLKVGNNYYFTGEDDLHGEELWLTDGTKSGTVLVKDINPGVDGSQILYMVSANGLLYFSAINNGDDNRELWTSDGTEAGTAMVKEINVANTAVVGELAEVNGKVYFSAFDGVPGNFKELWESDGTEVGTKEVKGSIVNAPSEPMFLTSSSNKLFFIAPDFSTISTDFWVTDVINTTAEKLQSFNGYEAPVGIVNVDDTLYFLMSKNTDNKELWISDGTELGTKKIKDIPGASFIKSINLVNVNGTLYFSNPDNGQGTADLWKSDGTTSGTVIVKNNTAWKFFTFPLQLTGVNSQLFFTANAIDNALLGRELWKSDGTTEGTRVVKDFTLQSDEGSNPEILGQLNNMLLFVADDDANGINNTYLWKTDGTVTGTVKIQNQ